MFPPCFVFGSGSELMRFKWVSRSGLGLGIRIQAGWNCPQKRKKRKKFHVWRVLCWDGGVSWKWNLNVLFKGSETAWIRIRIQGILNRNTGFHMTLTEHISKFYLGTAPTLLTQVLLLTIDGDGVDGGAGQEVTTRDTAHLRLTPPQEPLYNWRIFYMCSAEQLAPDPSNGFRSSPTHGAPGTVYSITGTTFLHAIKYAM